MTVRARLAGLVLACVLPVWLAVGLVLDHAYDNKRATVEQGVLDSARALSLTVDREVGRIEAGLEALATSPSLATGDMPAFYRQTRDVGRLYPEADIVLADANGQQLVNSFVSYGTLLPKRGVLESVHKVFAEEHSVISGLFLGAVTGRPLAGVDVPVRRGDTVVYDLAMTMPAEHIGEIVSAPHLPPNAGGAIIDQAGVVLARSKSPELFVGKKVGADLIKLLSQNSEGVVERTNLEGVKVLEAYSRSPSTGWTVVVGIPKAILTSEMRNWLWWSVTGAASLSMIGLVLAMVMARSIAGPIRALMDPAHALGRGEPVDVPPLALQEADEVAQALVRAAAILHRREMERETAVLSLADHAKMVQRQYESLCALNDISALPDGNPTHQLTEALALGVRHLHLSIGVLSHIENSRYTVKAHFSTPGAGLADGQVQDLAATYCSLVIAADDVVAITHMSQSAHAGHPCFKALGWEAYIGAPVIVRGQRYGTLCFAWKRPYKRQFDEGDREFMRLLARWAGMAVERELSRSELARSNAELENFAYVASHDLREPLRQVSSYVTLLERRCDNLLDDEAKQYVAFARSGAKRMDQLIHDLLEYAHIGRRNRPMGPVNLAELVPEAIDKLRPVIEAARAKVEILGPLPTVYGERDELRRVFVNLLDNALKYRSPERPPVIAIDALHRGEQWVITTKDNGIGIGSEYFERIFGLFQRLHGREDYDGTGIGLAICKKITEQHGGDITVDSVLGEGSAFKVVLPVMAT